MKNLAHYKSLLGTSLISALALAYIVIVFLPQQRAIAGLRAQLQEKQDFILQSERLRPVVETKTREVREAEAFVSVQQQRVPTVEQVPDVFGRISDHVRLAGVRNERFEPEPTADLGSFRKIPVRIAIEGSFTQLFALLHGLEDTTMPLWIEDLQILRDSENGASLECKVNLAVFAAEREISD
jgi:Tfp pilus assembly protein PilO